MKNLPKLKQMKFNEFVREKRKELNMTLRKFCQTKGYDTAYISRLENGLLNPPKEKKKLEALAFALEIEENTAEWVAFFDLAAASHLSIPEDIKKDFPEIVRFLPAFYRTLRNESCSEKKIENLISLLAAEEEL